MNLVEKERLDHICRLLEITERECHHELLLFVKNLQDLGANPFPYIVSVLPHPLPKKVVKGEHFVLMDLLDSALPRQGRSGTPYPARSSTFGRGGSQACSPSEKKEEGQAGEGSRQRTRGFCGLDESRN